MSGHLRNQGTDLSGHVNSILELPDHFEAWGLKQMYDIPKHEFLEDLDEQSK